MADALVLPRPDDFHAHFRSGPAAAAYAARHALCFGRAVAMPNTLPPIASAAALESYRAELEEAAPGMTVLPTFKLLPGMGAEAVLACAAAGAVAGKYYPAGATTNAEDGVPSPDSVRGELEAMEEAGLVLSIHGEDPAAPALEREAAFLPSVEAILARHGRLRIVLEHVSSREGMAFVLGGDERLACTLTAHHLLFTIDDLLGGALDPHLHCKPVLKGARDRRALRDAAFSGRSRVFFGSDSAPHPRSAKEGGRAASGVWSAPTAICALAGLFEAEASLGDLVPFVAGRGAAFYGLEPPSGSLELLREEWTVPEELDGAVPMLAGRRLAWRLGRARRGA